MAQQQLAPFAFGTKPQYVVLPAITYSPNTTQYVKVPKAGYIADVKFLCNGNVTVNLAGAAGTPKLQNLIKRYSLNVSFGYEYRSLQGDSLYFRNQLDTDVNDPVFGSQAQNYENYNPASATQQNISMVLGDLTSLNRGLNFDKYLIPYQSLSKSIYLSLTFGAISDIYANTETINAENITITPVVTFMSVPDESKFAPPDTSMVQQILDEEQLTNQVKAGLNLCSLTPINGPEYIGLGFKLTLNGAPDPGGYATNLSKVRLLANSTIPVLDLPGWRLIQLMNDHFKRALPAGWFYFPFSDDISLVNAMGPAEREVFATADYTQLDLEITLNSGTVVGANNGIRIFKRLQSQSVPA